MLKKQKFSSDDPNIAITLNNIGNVFKSLSDY